METVNPDVDLGLVIVSTRCGYNLCRCFALLFFKKYLDIVNMFFFKKKKNPVSIYHLN